MNIVLARGVVKQYTRLPQRDKSKVKRKMTLLKTNQFTGKKLSGEFSSWMSLSAWPYRIVYRDDKREKQVSISAIIHRQGAYK